MTSARWVTWSSAHPDVEDGTLALHVAHELTTRHHVAFWALSPTESRPGKTLAQIIPYHKTFSPTLLRNFLRNEKESLCFLQGPPLREASALNDILTLIKNSFDFIFVAATPTWRDEYLTVLDSTNLLFMIAQPQDDLSSHFDQLTKHKFPKALAQVISKDLDPRQLAKRLETDTDIYCQHREISEDSEQKAKARIHERLLDATSKDHALPTEQTQTVLEKLVAEETALPVSREPCASEQS